METLRLNYQNTSVHGHYSCYHTTVAGVAYIRFRDYRTAQTSGRIVQMTLTFAVC